MTLVDSHCHLDDAQFNEDREAAIARAQAAGISTLLAVGTGGGPPDLEAGIRLAEAYPFIYATVGVHPHDASKAVEETFVRLAELLRHPKVLALGEIGLDYHYDLSPRERQREVFARQVALARAAAKPVVIHTREAWADTLAALGEGPGILHCFSEGPQEAQQALERGFHISFAGMVTFPRAERVHAAARIVPLERLLVETDAPYLAPVPLRGKRNEPAFVVETVRRLAELRAITPEEIAAATTDNFHKLFGLD
jgi:TatD DNase family protein